MNTDFSAAALQTLRTLDTNKNGVSPQELKAIDTNGDQNVSAAEAEVHGLNPQDVQLINKALEKGSSAPTLPILMDTAQVFGWEEISSELINDAAIGFSASTQFNPHYFPRHLDAEGKVSLLKERLGEQATQVEPLIDFLASNDLLHHSQMESLVKRLGADQAAKIGKQIQGYWQAPTSRLDANERKALVKDLIKELGSPVTVTQGGKGTCAACAVQMKLLIENPRAYTQMALKLVEGQSVKSPGGDMIEPNETWRLPGVKYGENQNRTAGDHRSLSSKALQNAFMNEALSWSSYESNADYDNNEDAPNIGQQAKLLTKVFGEQSFDADYWGSGSSKLSALEDDLARGRSAVANFKGHAILVVGLDKSGDKDKVLFWSDDAQYQMDARQFAKDVVSIVTVDDSGRDNRKLSKGQRHTVSTDVHQQAQYLKQTMQAIRDSRR